MILKSKVSKTQVSLIILFLMVLGLGIYSYKLHETASKQEKEIVAQDSYNSIRAKYQPVNVDAPKNTVYFADWYTSVMLQNETARWWYTHQEGEKTGEILDIANGAAFEKPKELAAKPYCVPMVELRERKRPTNDSYEDEPFPITVNKESKKTLYLYSPRLGVCSDVYGDEQLLLTRQYGLEVKSAF